MSTPGYDDLRRRKPLGPGTEEWYYYRLDYGQQVPFSSLGTLEHLADRFLPNLYSDGGSLHRNMEGKLGKRRFRRTMGFRGYQV